VENIFIESPMCERFKSLSGSWGKCNDYFGITNNFRILTCFLRSRVLGSVGTPNDAVPVLSTKHFI